LQIRGGFDQAVYNTSLTPITGINVTMTATVITVTGDASIGTDKLTSIESVRGTNLNDTYNASGFNGGSDDLPLPTTFNEFEGMAGNDTITGNGDTRISYISASAGVTVDLVAGTAAGNASVGTDTITGGVTRVRGSNFNDTISGDGNNNVLEGLGGDDTLTGLGGNDTFLFRPNFGHDTITDFHPGGEDFIDIDHTLFADIAAILSSATPSGANTVITDAAGDTITLVNVAPANLHASDFHLI
jgi:Ca2+-binding RTX toxin-like protein